MSRGKKVTELTASAVSLLQQDWKKGDLPVKVLALKYGVDIDDLRATAKREQWAEDQSRGSPDLPVEYQPESLPEPPLQQQIERAALEANVDRVVSDDDRDHGRTEPRVMDQGATIKQFGMVVAGVQSQQREDIRRLREYSAGLVQRLNDLGAGPRLAKERIDALAQLIGDSDPEFVKALTESPEAGDVVGELKVLDKQASILTKLALVTKETVQLERQAYGLDKPGGQQAGYDELLQKLIDDRKRNGKTDRSLT